ncbi:MAG: ABC transporter permease [Armatimonadetes bacterium]|nr:ABC transporter permease [Anaerolineae bacterium]
MGKYLTRRILQSIPLLIIVTVLVFFLTKLAGDPLASLNQDPRVTERDRAVLRSKYGLDDPLPLQFVHWLIGDDWYLRQINIDFTDPNTGERITQSLEPQYGERLGVIRGDFGESIRFQRDVTTVINQRIPPTLILMITQYIVTLVFALALGMYSAIRPYSTGDNVITAFSFILFSMPVFLVALLLVQVFAVQLRILPVQGMYDVRGDRSVDELMRHLILPVVSLAAINVAGYSRYIRSTMLEVINSDYVRTARAKGLSERRVTYLHALKNAALPLVTLIGLDIPFLLGGAVITETIFSWPGMGFMYIEALNFLDAPLIVAFVLITAVSVVFFQLLTDIVYSWLDPRIRYN